MELSPTVPAAPVTEKNQRTIQYTIHCTYHKKKLFLNIPNSTFFLLGMVGVNALSDSTESLFYKSDYYNQ